MSNRRYPVLATFGLLFMLVACGSTASPNPASPANEQSRSAAQTIQPDEMYTRIAFLSSDELGGRDTPSPGLETAAAYLVAEYQAMGLEPGGDRGTFYQRYPFAGRGTDFGAPAGDETSFPPNVIAVLPGSDPALRDEYVVLSAHFDHVGIGAPIAGDSIYNGADDNGTGTAALLEVAEAFTALPQAPRRSIVFLHVSGEEHGLLGSQYFSENPTVPLDQIVANVNVDMIGRNAPDSIVVIGKEYSTLGDVVNRAGREHPELGLTVSDDIWPQERFFFRSDHFNFARKGVPAIFFFSGVHEDYHKPSDTVDKINTSKAARVAQLIYHTVEAIANDTARPEWDRAGWQQVQRLTR